MKPFRPLTKNKTDVVNFGHWFFFRAIFFLLFYVSKLWKSNIYFLLLLQICRKSTFTKNLLIPTEFYSFLTVVIWAWAKFSNLLQIKKKWKIVKQHCRNKSNCLQKSNLKIFNFPWHTLTNFNYKGIVIYIFISEFI